jgi:hypothetical protein
VNHNAVQNTESASRINQTLTLRLELAERANIAPIAKANFEERETRALGVRLDSSASNELLEMEKETKRRSLPLTLFLYFSGKGRVPMETGGRFWRQAISRSHCHQLGPGQLSLRTVPILGQFWGQAANFGDRRTSAVWSLRPFRVMPTLAGAELWGPKLLEFVVCKRWPGPSLLPSLRGVA